MNSDLQEFRALSVPRRYFDELLRPSTRLSVVGYCDASLRAYAAVIYLCIDVGSNLVKRFLCPKTRIAPVKSLTIPQLELLSALLLARLVEKVQEALQPEVELGESICYTDSQVALCWIQGQSREWKQFMQNRVVEIRKLVPADHWKHCPGDKNLADIPSRGVNPSEFKEKCHLWLHGPDSSVEELREVENSLATIPEDCLYELKAKDRENVSVSLLNSSEIEIVIDCLRYSSLTKLVRVTGYVLKFIRNLKGRHTPTTEGSCALSTDDVNDGLRYWPKILQLILIEMKEFELWKQQFGLFKDSDGLWRCRGSLSNAELQSSAKHPILLPKDHHVTKLIIWDCHIRVMHSGTKATLTELRSRYWIISGRQTVRKLFYGCTVCHRYQGKPYSSLEAPPLPSFRVQEALPFSDSGIDYAGPLYVQSEAPSRLQKVWICLFTCCVTRGVHLEIVPDMTAEAFIRCFRRFTSRRGFPCRIVTNNAKTFKAAAKTLETVLKCPKVKCFFSHINVKWTFNQERAPWWG